MKMNLAAGTDLAARAVSVWLLVMAPLFFIVPAGAETSVAGDIEQPVARAINTRQATQAAQEKWDGERRRLVARYDLLKVKNQQLKETRDRLLALKARLGETNRALEAEKAEAVRIANEMAPHLAAVAGRMQGLIEGDAPFLARERNARMSRLSAILEDPEVSVAEKYRKTMEALFIEVEYGNTVEVYQEKVRLEGNEVLGNIFRLGRVSLFFLSLDQTGAAVFDVAAGQWVSLGAENVQAIAGVTAMAAKHRPMEVVSLPVGRLAPAAGGDHGAE